MEHFVYGVIATLAWALFIYLNDKKGRMYWLVVTGFVVYALLMGCIAHYLFGFEDFGVCMFIFGPLWAWLLGLVGYNILSKIRCTH